MTELVENLERLDKAYLQNILYRINEIVIFCRPQTVWKRPRSSTPATWRRLSSYLNENLGFRSILIDCCHQFDEITLKALELSDILMLVTAQSVPALSNAKKMLEILNLLELKDLDIRGLGKLLGPAK